MSWWFWVLLFIVFVLWTFLMLIAGASYQKQQEVPDSAPATVNMNFDATEFNQQIDAMRERVSALDQQVQHVDQLQKADNRGETSAGALRRLESIEGILQRLNKLEGETAQLLLKDAAYQDRFTRVERRAGMSV